MSLSLIKIVFHPYDFFEKCWIEEPFFSTQPMQFRHFDNTYSLVLSGYILLGRWQPNHENCHLQDSPETVQWMQSVIWRWVFYGINFVHNRIFLSSNLIPICKPLSVRISPISILIENGAILLRTYEKSRTGGFVDSIFHSLQAYSRSASHSGLEIGGNVTALPLCWCSSLIIILPLIKEGCCKMKAKRKHGMMLSTAWWSNENDFKMTTTAN